MPKNFTIQKGNSGGWLVRLARSSPLDATT
jgi:hypothetical protein